MDGGRTANPVRPRTRRKIIPVRPYLGVGAPRKAALVVTVNAALLLLLIVVVVAVAGRGVPSLFFMECATVRSETTPTISDFDPRGRNRGNRAGWGPLPGPFKHRK